MNVQLTLLKEIEESQRWLRVQKEESTYRRDLKKRIELINSVLEQMKKPDINICALLETKINGLIGKINEKDSI
ncbi:MAG TPA: hypothetical protein VJM74_04190 [Nitrososphaeraceae archaeon]|jgi:hypothetical protein|nr:hypothetical protein [Nitrososphaeraceae archaeon]